MTEPRQLPVKPLPGFECCDWCATHELCQRDRGCRLMHVFEPPENVEPIRPEPDPT